jgi:hypothetical protein
MSDFDHLQEEQATAELNRRKPENRWRRILRDAEWDQNETVRRWLRLARTVLGDKEEKDNEPVAASHDTTKSSDVTRSGDIKKVA